MQVDTIRLCMWQIFINIFVSKLKIERLTWWVNMTKQPYKQAKINFEKILPHSKFR